MEIKSISDITYVCGCGSNSLEEAIDIGNKRNPLGARYRQINTDHISQAFAQDGNMCFCMAFKFAESVNNNVILNNYEMEGVLVYTIFRGWWHTLYSIQRNIVFDVYRPSLKDLNSVTWVARI